MRVTLSGGSLREQARLANGALVGGGASVPDPADRGYPERPPQQPSARAITICCTSSVPSPIVRIFASR
jgi:hypothetical protein